MFNQYAYQKKQSAFVILDDSDDDIGSVHLEDELPSLPVSSKRKRAKIDSYSDDENDLQRVPKQKKIFISDDEEEYNVNGHKNDDVKEVVELEDTEDEQKEEDEEDSKTQSSLLDQGDSKVSTSSRNEEIFQFLDTCVLEELLAVPSVSRSRAVQIISMRPFTDYNDLMERIGALKGFSFSKLLECCMTYRSIMQRFEALLETCKRLSIKTEREFILMNQLYLTTILSQNYIALKTENFTKDFLNVQQPSTISDGLQLKHYQLIGLNWMAMLFENDVSGILADQMGLGKTIQTLAFVAYLVENGFKGPHLIVCPCSTLDNWLREIARWVPSIQYALYSGTTEERRYIRKEITRTREENSIIITTYNMLLSTPKDREFFQNIKLHYLIMDEAHLVKNMKTERFRKLMKIQAPLKLLLTGTPVQNDLTELVSLLTFLMPQMFSSHQEGINMLLSRQAQNPELEPYFQKTMLHKMKKILQPFILRRLKCDVLDDLPAKSEHICICEMNPLQRKLYQNFVEIYQKKQIEPKQNENSSFTTINNLRKVINHPLLLRNLYNDKQLEDMTDKYCSSPFHMESDPKAVLEDMQVMSDFELHSLCKNEKILRNFQLDEKVLCDCAKFKELDLLLPKLKAEGHRVLMFSQFVIMLNIIEEYMRLRGYTFLRFDGSTKGCNRQVLVDKYNNEEDEYFAFLLSTKAGGLGINLTSADTVIFFDIDFNPYNDKQAEDRCHRVGQTKDVTVYKLIARNTIEENMLKIGEKKLMLERNLVGDGDDDLDCLQNDEKRMVASVLNSLKTENTQLSS